MKKFIATSLLASSLLLSSPIYADTGTSTATSTYKTSTSTDVLCITKESFKQSRKNAFNSANARYKTAMEQATSLRKRALDQAKGLTDRKEAQKIRKAADKAYRTTHTEEQKARRMAIKEAAQLRKCK